MHTDSEYVKFEITRLRVSGTILKGPFVLVLAPTANKVENYVPTIQIVYVMLDYLAWVLPWPSTFSTVLRGRQH